MHQQAVRIRGIVEDMLTLSTLESAEADQEHAYIDVAGMLRALKEEAEILAAEKRHRFSLEAEPGSTLQANPDEIRSAFSNLVSNAVRYTPPGGSIGLRWWTDAAGGHFAVADNGIGIEQDHIPRLTERFYRVDTARSRETGGTGLGLAIVKHALGRVGGHLSIESEPGAGSTFTCHFPPHLLGGEKAGESEPAPAPSTENVLPFPTSAP
jgi:two-component system phosphate regulon sensor histidine kinase PhoR